ncbi:cobalamin-binding protein [Candidatus Bathyarchaeota archaeon B24-2]|nr:MAG: cobalamin-binding protein [Candidatus Bathyarchaeota archaeon B24-2]
MGKEEILEKISKAIVEFDIDNIKNLVNQALEAGIPALDIVTKGMAKGMEIVGKKYEKKEYFLAELIMAGEVMKTGMEVLEPHLKATPVGRKGVVVIGTVKGDLHDIGKNIVITLLKSSGFEVHDLGVDVDAQRFVEKVKETNADILALSALLTTTMVEMENVIKALKEASIRDKVKVIVGGAPITEEFASKIGADAFAVDAVQGVQKCKEMIAQKA